MFYIESIIAISLFFGFCFIGGRIGQKCSFRCVLSLIWASVIGLIAACMFSLDSPQKYMGMVIGVLTTVIFGGFITGAICSNDPSQRS
jgi:hypothetical protein